MLNAKRIVIKIGSSLLIGDDGAVRVSWLATLASDIAGLKAQQKEVIIVTSGAVALGRHVLGYGARKLELEEKQAAAACGQIPLFSEWQKAFAPHNIYPAQILLTAEDSIDRRRYLNARNTLDTLLENATIVPVINENDTVATQELRFGDNDRLAARVAQMAGADLLVLFSDIDGLYDADPRANSSAKLVETVETITPAVAAMAGGVGSSVGSGGMVTKIEAAQIATQAGCHMLIAKGINNHPVQALQHGAKHTHFVAQGTPMSARKNWIAGAMHTAGSVVVDEGAQNALQTGKSLLPAGVMAAQGNFERGDCVLIYSHDNRLLGRGLIAYDAADAHKILGKKTTDIEAILGFKGRDVLIHRDDMVLISPSKNI